MKKKTKKQMKQIFSIIIVLITVIISYLALFSMWKKYYLIKDNLYSLLKNDTELEISFYKVITL